MAEKNKSKSKLLRAKEPGKSEDLQGIAKPRFAMKLKKAKKRLDDSGVIIKQKAKQEFAILKKPFHLIGIAICFVLLFSLIFIMYEYSLLNTMTEFLLVILVTIILIILGRLL